MPSDPVRIRYLGQSTFKFTTPEHTTVLIDPWTVGNPLCPAHEKDARDADLILVTHAHHDHLGDLLTIARDGRPKTVAIAELGNWLGTKGLSNVYTMNVGGIVQVDGVGITMTPAVHSSSVDDEPLVNVGVAVGFVLEFSDGHRVYHAGDTAAFAGMSLIHEVYQPELAMLPIGDPHTMGPQEAAVATRLLEVDRVIPMHYGVTPGSERAPARFRAALDELGLYGVEMLQMAPGEEVSSSPHRAWHGPT